MNTLLPFFLKFLWQYECLLNNRVFVQITKTKMCLFIAISDSSEITLIGLGLPVNMLPRILLEPLNYPDSFATPSFAGHLWTNQGGFFWERYNSVTTCLPAVNLLHQLQETLWVFYFWIWYFVAIASIILFLFFQIASGRSVVRPASTAVRSSDTLLKVFSKNFEVVKN